MELARGKNGPFGEDQATEGWIKDRHDVKWCVNNLWVTVWTVAWPPNGTNKEM